MLGLMLVLGAAGAVLLVAAPVLARAVAGGSGDAVGLTRLLQLVGVALLIIALVVRPHNPSTAAFPPSPDAVDTSDR